MKTIKSSPLKNRNMDELIQQAHARQAQAMACPLPEEERRRDPASKRLNRFMRGHEGCDGTNQVGLRQWLERENLAVEFIPHLTVRDARETWAAQTNGTLIQALRTYTPENPTVSGLLDHVRQQCVAVQEEDKLVMEVEQYRQGSGQTTLEYVAQFRLRVNRAYTAHDFTFYQWAVQ